MTDVFSTPDEYANELRSSDLHSSLGERLGAQALDAIDPQDSLSGAWFFRRLREGIAGLSLTLPGGPQQVTVSIGAAAWENGMSGTGDLMRAADAQLYRAKQDGRNRVCSMLAP